MHLVELTDEELKEINNPKQFIADRSIQEPRSTSDIADAFNFFNKIYSDNTKL